MTPPGLHTPPRRTTSQQLRRKRRHDLRARSGQIGALRRLRNEPLTAAEYDQIRLLGAEIEYLTGLLSTIIGWSGHRLMTEADEDMAVVADVHTGPGGRECLEEGAGHGNRIYVVVPIGGEFYLTRGAAFSHYESRHPAEDRLTDGRWQEMLEADRAPSPIPYPRVPRQKGHGC